MYFLRLLSFCACVRVCLCIHCFGRRWSLPCHTPHSGHVMTMAVNEWAYVVLATALSVVDDTAMMAKVIVAEMKVRMDAFVGRLGSMTTHCGPLRSNFSQLLVCISFMPILLR